MAANVPEPCHHSVTVNDTAPPTLLLWQTVLAKKKKKPVPVSEERVKGWSCSSQLDGNRTHSAFVCRARAAVV